MFAVALSGSGMSPSDQWLFEKLESMREEQTEQHQRLRADMNAGFDRLREELKAHNQDLAAVDRRVLTMEVQRDEERKAVARRQWGIGVVITLVLWVIGQLSEFFGKR